MRIVALVISIVASGLVASGASAQDAGTPELDEFRRMVDADPFTAEESDPIGTSAGDAEMRTMRLPEPEEIVEERIPPVSGDVLTAIPGVRETEHRAEIELREGVAIVHERITLTSSARVPAEARYRLAVPEGAVLVALEVCAAGACRTGIADRTTGPLGAYDDAARASGSSAAPIAHATNARDERGDAIVVRAAPVRRAGLEVRVAWAVRTIVRGGRVRFLVPARGNDARVVDTRWTVRAIDLVAPSIDGVPIETREETRPSSVPIALGATLPLTAGVRATASSVPCAAGRCARLRVVAGRPSIAGGDVIVAIDASPSTVASARGRIAPTVRTLLSMLPSGARVRVVAFAARAEEVGASWVAPTAVDSGALDLAVERELGSATRFEALWALVGPWARRGTRVVIVGDGGLTASATGAGAFASAAREGVILASVDVADRASTTALRSAIEGANGVVIDAGAEAQGATAGRGSEPLVARLTSALAPVAMRAVSVRIGDTRHALGVLREGEELVWEGPLSGATTSASITVDGTTTRASAAGAEIGPALTALADRGATALAAIDASDVARGDAGSCRARGPYASNSGVVARGETIALAHTRRCDPPPATSALDRPRREHRSGVPARVLLASLRRRVIPPARACFRADRAGRASYQERAELRVELADREIVAVQVGGAIEEALRTCLEGALDGLDVPGFDGRVIVTWPLYTAPTLPPPVLELRSDVADEVDRVATPE
ncbi:VWA domain-containing protein [Sandaracinus amylolyticus]|uniref:VWFA domain-containing protein n=1 Tax=Sandaracinus amylolyticus TaxID=927083 RepID=A0A0F6YLZ1_9BACT|nr:VWA domain-containing protein [Sandaracinus amylolyticus]AKF10091.1 hypothetical protein DB32_007240 [Sandaracinus amylolyticus]